MTLILGVEKVSEHALIPTRDDSPKLDYELFCSEETVIPAHATETVKTGLVLSVPSGTYARIIPHSGPVINIENGQEIDVIVYNEHFKEVKYRRGRSIARIIVVAHADVKVIETDTWVSEIDTTKDEQTILTETQKIIYVASKSNERNLDDSLYTWNALVRLNKHVMMTESTENQVCIAIGCRDLQGATVIVIDAVLQANDPRLAYLKDLPLYYVDLDTKQCISAREALAFCEDPKNMYDECVF